VSRFLLGLGILLLIVVGGPAVWGVPAPPSYTVEGMPRIGWRHAWRSLEVVRGFSARRQFAGWYGHERRMFVAAGTTNRFLLIDGPGAEAVSAGIPERAFAVQWSRDVERPWVTYALDTGGDELYRFFRHDIATGESVALTHVAARAYAAGFDPEGCRLAFTSNARNGVDSDIYVVDVDEPARPRLVYDTGGDLWLSGWTGDGRILAHRLRGMERSESFLLDSDTGEVQQLFTELDGGAVIRRAERARRGNVIYLATDLDGEYVSLHALDPATGATTLLTPQLSWDVVDIAVLPDNETLVLIVNEDSVHKLYRFDLPSMRLSAVPAWPGGFPVRVVAHPSLPLVAIDVVDNAGITGGVDLRPCRRNLRRLEYQSAALPDTTTRGSALPDVRYRLRRSPPRAQRSASAVVRANATPAAGAHRHSRRPHRTGACARHAPGRSSRPEASHPPAQREGLSRLRADLRRPRRRAAPG
jgi:hypothetical protein